MEQITRADKEKRIYEHSFYCDECGKHLGTSKVYDDGWYESFGELELSFYIDGWYRLKTHLCSDCADVFLSNLKYRLDDMGFVKD